MTSINSIHIGIIRKVALGSTLVWVIAVAATAWINPAHTWGVVLGGGAMLGIFAFYRWLAPGLFNPGTQRRYKALFWIAWILKWPILGVIFYYAFNTGLASAVGIGIGLGIIPLVATALVLCALLWDTCCVAARGGTEG